MKIIVISYSFTGNNEALANSIAAEFTADHIKITEPKPRTMGAIIFDILLNRTPQVNPIAVKVEDNDLVLFVGPVWLGQVASPFRSCFKQLQARLGRFAFISISGGALGPNPKLVGELNKRIGKKPATLIDLQIADLLPSNPKPTMKDTSAYRLSDRDVKNLTNVVVKTLRETMALKGE